MLGAWGRGEKIRRTGNHRPGVAGTGAEKIGSAEEPRAGEEEKSEKTDTQSLSLARTSVT